MSHPAFHKEIGVEESGELSEVYQDLKKCSSALELMSNYLDEVRGRATNNPHVFTKLAALFKRGRAPENVEGHCYGVTMGLRTGVLIGSFNLLNFLWGRLLAKNPPWVGKGFHIKDSGLEPKVKGSPGINFFWKNRVSLLNRISILILTALFRLKKSKEEERDVYGYDKKGGMFVGHRTGSVNPGAEEKEVFQINYRWPFLKSPFPLKLLIDEIVEIADGLYLGQLLFATRRIFRAYDPSLPNGKYRYSHFGYFLLMDKKWDAERRRFFPYTEDVWKTRASSIRLDSSKFKEFTFAEPAGGRCDDSLLKEVMADMEGKETVLDLLKFYSMKLKRDRNIYSPYFSKLNEIFNRGIAPKEVRGYFHGAVVAFRNEGLIKLFNINTLNMLWPLARRFSPWTGKTFEDMEIERLKDMTGGVEKGDVPTFWGTNTYVRRRLKQKITVGAMRLLNIWIQKATDEEVRQSGYDLKSFFFIARQGLSVNPDNDKKTVFYFNYRWPKLRTFPPDHYCIDELVQVAEGLYLGQLVYATSPFKRYDPTRAPSDYKYRNFGYFLLMDDDWHARRLDIGFDVIRSVLS
jgi:hypothetical protein